MPDLIVFSLPFDITNSIFWDVYRQQAEGRRFETGKQEQDVLGEDFPVMMMPVDPERYKDHMTYTRWFHLTQPFEARQLVWPTKDVQWPWDPEIAVDMAGIQPAMSTDGWPKIV